MNLVHIDNEYGLFIGGKWVKASGNGTFKTTCPANGELLSICADAAREDVDNAVRAAQSAFPAWKAVSPSKRADILGRIADAIEKNAERLAMIETLDLGKPIRESSAIDIPNTADLFRYYAGVIRTEEAEFRRIDQSTLSVTVSEPLGVVGLIVPWNFPLMIAVWKLAPALAAGNCVVIKPSMETSLSLLTFAQIVQDILPPGVLNVVTGSGSRCGSYLLEHPGIRKLSFTGSTGVGYKVAQAAAEKLIPATLELGGKGPNIYFPDCNLDAAVEGVQLGILFNQGEVCCAGSRVFIHEDIYDEFIAALIKAFNRVKVGMPWEMSTEMGCPVSESHLLKILEYVEIGKKEGAKVACGGKRIVDSEFAKGCFMEPTLLVDVKNSMCVAQEEIFGPVAVAVKFSSEEEVIAMANDCEYGLAGAVWTRDINRAIRMAGAIECGRIWVNCSSGMPSGAPFGGYKKSGYGRELHKSTLEHYRQTKNVLISTLENPIGLYS